MTQIDNTAILKAARSVPCIEVRNESAGDAARTSGPYYPDETELLVTTLKRTKNRLSVFVALDSNGLVNIYRKPKEARP